MTEKLSGGGRGGEVRSGHANVTPKLPLHRGEGDKHTRLDYLALRTGRRYRHASCFPLSPRVPVARSGCGFGPRFIAPGSVLDTFSAFASNLR